MRLEEYWGVGPKTRELLEAELGVEAAVEAIETADSNALIEAGVSRGRATRILRRANGGEEMDLLATGDARSVYREILDLASEHALTRRAEDRIRVLTPLRSREAMTTHLESVLEARDSWRGLDGSTRAAVEAAFEGYDSVAGGDLAAVRAALALREAGVEDGAFAPVADLDGAALSDAADALAALSAGGVREGADDRLDRLRDRQASVDDLAADPAGVVEAVRSGGLHGTDAFREGVLSHVAEETGEVREAMPMDATDAREFVAETLRELADATRERVDEREREVAAGFEGTIERTGDAVTAAVEAVDDVAFYLSLARFAEAFDLVRPRYVDRPAIAVAGARNLGLVATGESVQPVTYALGEHDLDVPASSAPPRGDRVAVLTGANSGGKTTMLETLCQVAVLAAMGLPVPVESAEVGPVDAVVFHRRHASFNAGVLESTLRSVVPPLTDEGRTLMLVDEFEAITEPGSAADLLHGLVRLSVDRGALGAFVTHLADDLEPLPPEARVDGIFAEGLTPDLDLQVDYQPRFETVGRSTPEFIVSRLVANAGDRSERAGFETLAEAVGEEAVQRTLSDARWSA